MSIKNEDEIVYGKIITGLLIVLVVLMMIGTYIVKDQQNQLHQQLDACTAALNSKVIE